MSRSRRGRPRITYSAPTLRVCLVRDSGCGFARPESEFRVQRDGKWLPTRICLTCIARLDRQHNAEQRKKQKPAQMRLKFEADSPGGKRRPLPPTGAKNVGTPEDQIEFLLRESIKQQEEKKKQGK